MARPRPCIVCSRRVESGESRCDLHKVGGARPRSCVVCGIRTVGNYCAEHDPESEANRLERSPYRKHYNDPKYRSARQHRFELARGRCEACGVHLEPGGWECDHVVALRDGGTNAVANLRVLCKPCHRSKTAAERRARHADD